MTDRYAKIKENLLAIAHSGEGLHAVIAIGSTARGYSSSDEYSDIDLVLACESPDKWLYGDMLKRLGEVKISFTEPTLGGGTERRILFDGSLDVDLIVFTPERLSELICDKTACEVMNRGYAVLYDDMGITQLLDENVTVEVPAFYISEGEFINTANDFWFHTVWAAKKILRGELWVAKQCIDAYLKNHLLKITELYEHALHNKDVWHCGRFFERWADADTVAALKKCFAHYDKDELISALFATAELFGVLAKDGARACGYAYPAEAERYAMSLLEGYFPEKN